MHWLSRLPLTIAVAAGAARVARASEPPVEEVIHISIDAADLPATRSELATVAETELERLLAQQQSLPAGVFLADDRRVVVELRPGPIPGADDVLIHVAVHLDDTIIAESATEACLACSDEQVAEKALVLLEPLLPKLPTPTIAAAPAPVIEQADGEETDSETYDAHTHREWLISGAALLGTGLAGLGAGIGLIAANERVVSPPDALDLEVVKYREPGIATTALAGAAAVSGAVLLGLALDQRRSDTVAAPVITPGYAGLSLAGRF